MVSQIELAAGFYVLDRKEGTSQAGNFIKQVLFGPDKEVAEPTASQGTLVAEHGSWTTWDDWTYILSVPMSFRGGTAEVRFKFHISAENDAWPDEIVRRHQENAAHA